MPHLQQLKWDFRDNFKEATLDLAGNKAYYVYDASGNRVRKIVKKGSIIEDRIYIGNYEIYRKTTSGTLNVERETLNIMDDKQKIAQIDSEAPFGGLGAVIRYQLSDHLGSASVELDQNADIISYEEYYPFGSTSYRNGRTENEVKQKRYKYVMEELDNETGLYYYGMRYYCAWICRFVSVDPLQHDYPDLTPFQYASNRPISGIDLDGLEFIFFFDDMNKKENAIEHKEYVTNLINVLFEGQFEASWEETRSGAYILGMQEIGEGSYENLSEGAQILYDKITDEENDFTIIKTIKDNQNIVIGSWKSQTIDIGDLQAIGSKTEGVKGASAEGFLAHEMSEQYRKTQMGIPLMKAWSEENEYSMDEYNLAHKEAGVVAEDFANNNMRMDEHGSRKMNIIKLFYKEKDNSIIEVNLDIQDEVMKVNRISYPEGSKAWDK